MLPRRQGGQGSGSETAACKPKQQGRKYILHCIRICTEWQQPKIRRTQPFMLMQHKGSWTPTNKCIPTASQNGWLEVKALAIAGDYNS